MVVKYTNRKGADYFLCKGETKTGKPRYYFSREAKENSPAKIPVGYEIVESVNGVVSLAKKRAQVILPEELALVEKIVARHPKAEELRVGIKGKAILIYKRDGPDVEGLAAKFRPFSPLPPDEFNRILQETIVSTSRFSPVLRFNLKDKEVRTFSAERWVYLGNIDDWRSAGLSGRLQDLASEVIPLLGTDDFFDLI